MKIIQLKTRKKTEVLTIIYKICSFICISIHSVNSALRIITPLIFAKITILDLSGTRLWTYRKLVRGPIGNRFVDLSETGSWTYQKLVSGPIGNCFVDLSETSSWTYRKPVRGPIGNRFMDLTETGWWT